MSSEWGKEGRKQPSTAQLKQTKKQTLIRYKKTNHLAFKIITLLFFSGRYLLQRLFLGQIDFRKKKLILTKDAGLILITEKITPIFSIMRLFLYVLLTHETRICNQHLNSFRISFQPFQR